MFIHENHPFRILLISSLKTSDLFRESIKSANTATRIAIPRDKKSLESLLNKSGRQLPHLIFLDLVDPLEEVSETFTQIARCSILNNISIVIFTSLVPPSFVVETFSGCHTLYVRKLQTEELLTLSIQNILRLDWKKYTTEKVHAEPVQSKIENSRSPIKVVALN